MICFTLRIFSIGVFLRVITGAVLEIWPNLTEYVVTPSSSEDSRTLACRGNEPMQWYYEQYNGALQIKKNSSIKLFPTDQYRITYLSLLSLSRATYLDTGYYHCETISNKFNSIQESKKIYIFVQHNTHLLSLPEDISMMYQIRGNNVIIPCRPTSPQMNVRVIDSSYNLDVGRYVIEYNDKKGITIPTDFFFSYNMTCYAKRKQKFDNRPIPNLLEHFLRIVDGYTGAIVVGQNISLNCSYSLNYDYYSLEWKVPKALKNEGVGKTREFINKHGSIILDIRNVSAKDYGDYVCEIKFIDFNETFTKTYTLSAYAHNVTYLNLKIQGGVSKKILPAGYGNVRLTVHISASPNVTSLQWVGPDGRLLGTTLENMYVKNDNQSSELIIRNIKLSDSGVYTLVAYNGAESKETSVTLLVEDKPMVLFIKNLNSSVSFYEIGKVYNFEFYICGYPLPEVKWVFKKCSNYPICEQSFIDTTIIKNETIQLSEITLKLVISMEITDTGTLMCNASNNLGHFLKQYTVLATDGPNGLEMKGPLIIIEGGTFTIKCGVSKYKYLNNIKWIYPENSQIQQNINITKNETKLSYYSYLTIKNITKTLKGCISCTAKRIIRFNERQLETDIKSLLIHFEDHNTSWFITQSHNPIKHIEEDINIRDFVFCCSFMICLAVLTMGIVIYLKRDKIFKKTSVLSEKYNFENGAYKSFNSSLAVREDGCLLLFDKQWEFPANRLKFSKQIGSGAFGVVFKAEAYGIVDENTTTTVAVKTIKMTADITCNTEALISELKIMIHVGKHMNVVNFLGACMDDSNNIPMLIVEYCQNGSINQYMLKQRDHFINQMAPGGCITVYDGVSMSKDQNYGMVSDKTTTFKMLKVDGPFMSPTDRFVAYDVDPERHLNNYGDHDHKNTMKPLCTFDLISWSFQVARGMDYLASKNILHGDLATRNILLSEQNIVKICDFGQAKSLYSSEIYIKNPQKELFPIKWMAIESIRDMVFSTQSDVWSFGIVLWEIFSLAAVPYPNIHCYHLIDRLVEGFRMEQPMYANHKIYNIMLDCWKTEPKKRPSFNVLYHHLGELLQDFTKSFILDYMRAIEGPTVSELILNMT